MTAEEYEAMYIVSVCLARWRLVADALRSGLQYGDPTVDREVGIAQAAAQRAIGRLERRLDEMQPR